VKKLYRLTKEGHITLDGCGVASVRKEKDEWVVFGWWGEVYAKHTDRRTAVQQAVNTRRLGRIPAGATR
jgi:uncharacterized protein YbaA (DUF1428 family)